MDDPTQKRQTSRLLIDEPPLVIQPSLACAVGLNEALILQQVHYWLNRPSIGKDAEGRHWVRMTHDDWLEQLPFLGVDALRRAIKTIKKMGVLLSSRELSESSWDRSTWYSIDYAVLDAIDIPKRETASRKRNANGGNGAKHDAEPTSVNLTLHDAVTPPSKISKPDDRTSGDPTIFYTETTSETQTGIDTHVSIPRTVANAPDATAATQKENGAVLTEEEKTPPPLPDTPSPLETAPAGHVWIASADSVLGMTAHLGRTTSDKSRPICGARMKHRTTHMQHGAKPCAACVAKATAPPKEKKKQPPPDVKTYIAELCYGKGDGLIGASWSSIVSAWNEIGFPDLDKLEHFKRYWYLEYWLGKEKNKRPEPHQIVSQWDASIAWGGGTGQDDAAKEAAIMAELAEMAKYGKPRAVKNHE